MNCPHCQLPVFKKSAGGRKLKLSRSPVVLHGNGDVEVNCPHCRYGVVVGSVDEVTMRKATPRLVVRPRPPRA